MKSQFCPGLSGNCVLTNIKIIQDFRGILGPFPSPVLPCSTSISCVAFLPRFRSLSMLIQVPMCSSSLFPPPSSRSSVQKAGPPLPGLGKKVAVVSILREGAGSLHLGISVSVGLAPTGTQTCSSPSPAKKQERPFGREKWRNWD